MGARADRLIESVDCPAEELLVRLSSRPTTVQQSWCRTSPQEADEQSADQVDTDRAVLLAHDRSTMEKTNLTKAFDSFDEQWSPRVAAELNGQAVKLAKVEGEFVWHQHEDADELFLVRSGELTIEFRDDPDVVLEEGELLVVPRGVEHRPVADEEAEILLFEPGETQNTGNVQDDELTQTERRDLA